LESCANIIRYIFLGLESGTMAPFLGMAVDRWPARRLVFMGVIIWGCGVLWISQAGTLSMFYIGFLLVGLGGSLGIYTSRGRKFPV
jgi:MFS family permease